MSLFGGKYQLGPGDAVPFIGSQDEEHKNLSTHKFEEVDKCSACLMYAPSEAIKYPCGEVNRLGPSEYLMLDKRPEGWIMQNRVIHNPLP